MFTRRVSSKFATRTVSMAGAAAEGECEAEEGASEECRSPSRRKTAVRHLAGEDSDWRQLLVGVRQFEEEGSASEVDDCGVATHNQPGEDVEQGCSARPAAGIVQDTAAVRRRVRGGVLVGEG